MAKTAWGIETGASTLKAVKLTHDGKGNVTIEDYASIQMSQYRLAGGDDNVALVGALRELVASKGIKPTDTAYISLAGRHAFSRVITLPPVSQEAMRETIANEARGQIPIKLEDAVWDYQRISAEGAAEAQVNLYAVKREVVTSLMNACRSSGLPVKGIQLAPLGIYNFIKYEIDASFNRACVCIDIGADNSDLLIVDGEKTWIRVVPFAGNDVTKALLMKDKRLNPAMAESLKRDPMAMVKKFNETKPDPIWKDLGSVFEAMKPPLRDLVAEINRSVGFYKSQNESSDFRNLIMMGNGSRLINLPKFFEQQLQYQVFGINELTRIAVGRSLDPASIQGIAHTLAVPIGLALQATGVKNLATTNLIPQEMIAEEAAAKVRPLAVVGGAAIFLAAAVTLLMSFSQTSEAESTAKKLEEASKSARARKSELTAMVNGDVYRDLYAKSFNNAQRGQYIAAGAYDLVTSTIADFRSKNPNVLLISSRNPDNEAEGGIWLNESEHALRAPAVPDPRLPEGTVGPFGLERTTRVTASASLAIPLHVPMFLDAKDEKAAMAEADGHARQLKTRLAQRLALVLRPEAKVASDRAAWDREMRNEFGEGSALLQSMLNLRASHGAFPEKTPRGDALSDNLDDDYYRQWVELGGKLLGAAITGEEVGQQLGGKSAGITTLAGLRIYRARSYFHLKLTVNLQGAPWALPVTEAPAQ